MRLSIFGEQWVLCSEPCAMQFMLAKPDGAKRAGPYVQEGQVISASQWSVQNNACIQCASRVER